MESVWSSHRPWLLSGDQTYGDSVEINAQGKLMKRSALYVLAGTFAALVFSVPVAAQQDQNIRVEYFGTLGSPGTLGSSGSCSSLKGNPIQIDMQGDQLTIYWKSGSGKISQYKGKLQENSFKISSGSGQADFTGNLEAENIKFRYEQRSCRYTAVLKKKE